MRVLARAGRSAAGYENRQRHCGEKQHYRIKFITLEVGTESTYVPRFFEMLFPVAADSFPLLRQAQLRMEMHTSTVVLPLNVDMPDMSEKVVVPMDIVKDALKNASCIAGMNTCLCRDANDCEDYPHDVCCLFLGEASRSVVKHGLAKEFTYEEACARVDKAAEHGLMAQSVWIEVEQLLWGVRNDEMDKFVEICFCCPCCCIALRLARNALPEDRIRFHPAGWTAVPDRTKCIGCGKCKSKCPVDVIQIKQTMPMRAHLKDYFEQEYNLPLDVWKDE